ncbi:MAG0920 family protein [Mycoplasmopsis arginini]|uniref:MAG0920 family protein n=1 Tax=Mycoplasmopsis arginini TaxID=2094 RepID=UPI003D073700
MTLLIIYCAILSPLVMIYFVVGFYFIWKYNKKTIFTCDFKTGAKKQILAESIKLPQSTFDKFFEFFKKSKTFYISWLFILIFIFVFTLITYLVFYFTVSKKIDFYDSILLVIIFGVILEPLYFLIKGLIKINKTKKNIRDWIIENEKIEKSHLNIEKPVNYDDFRNIILNEDLEIRIPIFKNSESHFYGMKILNKRKKFINDGVIDNNELLYFILFDYTSAQINKISYTKENYLYFIKEILENEYNNI